jgi:acetoin utilization deacetylase AcuC-like enzyme
MPPGAHRPPDPQRIFFQGECEARVSTLIYHHDAFSRHAPPEGHPEQVARMAAVARGLAGVTAERREAPLAEDADILRCHPAHYLARLRDLAPTSRTIALDPDTWMSPGTLEAASRAVGGVCAAVDAVLTGAATNAFVACRPPGHHAMRDTAMGFCFFGTVAIGAMRALDHHGLSRVAVLDFDVHHGNGTQDLLWNEPRIRIISSQQMPFWPGTGDASERGAHGQITNLPLARGSGGAAMWAAWKPALASLQDWQPELIVISAGFDAHRDDPLAGLIWDTADYARLMHAICDLADACCAGRVVSSLEGGYDLAALAAAVAAHVGVMEERGR